jgi:hypothetical protein
VSAILKIFGEITRQLEIGFMNQRRGLQRMTGFLAIHMPPGHPV